MTDVEPTLPPPRKPRAALTGKQRRHLRGLAHHLEATLNVGKEGVSAGIEAAVMRALEDHELVKVRVLEAAPVDRKAAALPLAEAVGAHLVGTVGRVIILYRMRTERPEIALPRG